MVYKIKPLELSFDFEDRSYDLGDVIDIQVALAPNGEVTVRAARVDLICEERYVQAPGPASAQYASWSGVPPQARSATLNPTKETKETYVHSSGEFLRDARLPAGVPSAHRIRLRIQPAPPKHADEAAALVRDAASSWTFKWRLVASVDIVRGRNPKLQRTVKVRLPQTTTDATVGARPRMSTPKKSTGGSP
jgi:hypothetical protein